MTAFADPQLLAEIASCPTPMEVALRALDARLMVEVRRMRARGVTPLDELRGLYASEERVERLLGADGDPAPGIDDDDADAVRPSDHLMVHPAWRALARECAPTPLERDLVLLALARELRLDYELVFGFLNDDLTRRWPTRQLALRLLARDEADRARLRDALGESAPLARHGVLVPITAGEHASWLADGVAVSRTASALLGDAGAPESRLPPGLTVIPPDVAGERTAPSEALRSRLARVTRELWSHEDCPLVVVEGRDGSGRTRLAADLAATLEAPLLRVDMRDAPEGALETALVWQRLAGAVVLLDGVESWFGRDDAVATPPPAVLARLAAARGPVLLRLTEGARWHAVLGSLRVAHVELAPCTVDERAAAWREAIGHGAGDASLTLADALELADRFDLTPGRVSRVVRRAADEGALDDLADLPEPSREIARRVSRATRAESCDALAGLAVRAPTPHGWGDLVLPAPTMTRLRDFAAAIRDRAVVLDRWGFGRRAARARGVSALFAGASGTGKTMAASVVARELELDLFVVDLSTIVSKYIGETEKQLQRVFRAARDAGAILFFDEADALFGKRSEVKDAHDRYANIEVAYLLQQLDSHDGIVILATNLSRNLDAAFSRRMRYVLEFPLPAEADRLRLWRGIFPAEAPLDADVDLAFLAASFPLAGGDIRNVALESAYLAAADGGGAATIAMRHLVRAMARQMIKQGKTPSAAEFRQFVAMIDRDA